MHYLVASIASNTERPRSPHPDALAYGVEEAAHVLGISRRSVYELISNGRLDSLKLCGRRLISRTELVRLLADSTEL